MDPYVICLSCLSFLAALWSPAGKGISTWISCMCSFRVFCHFPTWFPESVVVHFYLIESIPDICLLPYLYVGGVLTTVLKQVKVFLHTG